MVFASSLSFLGLVLGSLSLSLVPSSIPFLYGFSRIITGIGTGGSIPIAYTRTTESAGQTEVTASSAFLLLLQSTSWLLGPTVLFVVLRFVDASSHRLTRTLQVVLLVASIPSLVSAIVLLRSSQTIIYHPLSDKEEVDVESRPPPRKHPPLRRAFLATGVCWFLYDLNSYGNTLFSRSIIRSLFEIPDTPWGAAIPLIIVGINGVLGQFVATTLLKRLRVQQLQAAGFLILSALFVLAAGGFSVLSALNRTGKLCLFVVYHLTFFFSLCGPGSTTFILPSLVFPEKDLSLYHGVCTCLGKFGGALGASFFPSMVQAFGVPRVGTGRTLDSRPCCAPVSYLLLDSFVLYRSVRFVNKQLHNLLFTIIEFRAQSISG